MCLLDNRFSPRNSKFVKSGLSQSVVSFGPRNEMHPYRRYREKHSDLLQPWKTCKAILSSER